MYPAGDLSPVQVSVWACQWVTLTLLRSSTVAQLKASVPVMSLSTRTAPLPLPIPRSWRFAPSCICTDGSNTCGCAGRPAQADGPGAEERRCHHEVRLRRMHCCVIYWPDLLCRNTPRYTPRVAHECTGCRIGDQVINDDSFPCERLPQESLEVSTMPLDL